MGEGDTMQTTFISLFIPLPPTMKRFIIQKNFSRLISLTDEVLYNHLHAQATRLGKMLNNFIEGIEGRD